MKRNFRALGSTLSLLLICGTLAGCSKEQYSYPDANWKDGNVAVIGGKTYDYSNIYSLMEGKKDSAKAYFDTASNVLAQLVTPRDASMTTNVDSAMESQEETWKSSASTNHTSYKEEMEKTLKSEGVLTEEELREKKLAAKQVEQNGTDYSKKKTYTDGYEYSVSEEETKAFVNKMAPYHISHILVKVDAGEATGTNIWSGKISLDNSKKIANTINMMAGSATFGDVALQQSDDTGSSTSHGELAQQMSTAGSGAGITMDKDTGYVQEFKLGLYAYDTYINPKTKGFTRKDGGKVVSIADDLRTPETFGTDEIKDEVENLAVKKGKAFGIPLSVALSLKEVADQEKADDGNSVKLKNGNDATSDYYPRNVLFNNYFNQHSISFVYDDSADYDTTYLAEYNASHSITYASLDAMKIATSDPSAVKGYKTYSKVRQNLNLIDTDKFQTVDGVSDSLVTLSTTTNTKSGDGYVRPVTQDSSDLYDNLSGSKKILCDEKKNPVIVVRSGSSGTSGYQGIHFIVVNHDRFALKDMSVDNDYKYYRTNKPTVETGTGSDTADYDANPSFVNFVKVDLHATAQSNEYSTRSDWVSATIKNYSTDSDFKRYEYNKQALKTKYNVDFDSLLDKNNTLTLEDGKTTTPSALIENYITVTENTASQKADDSLDTAWEQFVNNLYQFQNFQPAYTIPTVAIGYFQDGNLNDEKSVGEVAKIGGVLND